MSVLKVENITKKFGIGEATVIALKNINIEVKSGEFVVILGKSGSGKSTLIHLIAGLEKPTSGNIIVDGKNIFSLSENDRSLLRKKKIGLIFQTFNLIPVLTVEENIELPTINTNNKNKSYTEELMKILSIDDRRDHFPNQLSGGQQQRVAIARALINKPAIILADEPTGNLDSQTEEEVLKLLKESQKKYHQTVIMITHNEDNAKYADRIIKIQDGRIKEA